jgi:hypothetical protein
MYKMHEECYDAPEDMTEIPMGGTKASRKIPATYTVEGVTYKVRYIFINENDHEIAVMDISGLDAYEGAPFGGQCGDEIPVDRLFEAENETTT